MSLRHATTDLLMAAGLAAALLGAKPGAARAQGEHPQQTPGARQKPLTHTHDDLQPAQLPPLPNGMTIQTIIQGDSIYHGKGNCSACHGTEGEGLPAAGDAITVALNWAQYEWKSIDSLIDRGIPQVLTRSPIAMPPRGGKSNLTADETERVAAYVWAISQTRGEPWPGGHESHAGAVPAGVGKGTATRVLAKAPAKRKPQ